MTASASALLNRPRYSSEDPTLPKPWKALVDGSTGYLYFWNPETNVTQYEQPFTELPHHLPAARPSKEPRRPPHRIGHRPFRRPLPRRASLSFSHRLPIDNCPPMDYSRSPYVTGPPSLAAPGVEPPPGPIDLMACNRMKIKEGKIKEAVDFLNQVSDSATGNRTKQPLLHRSSEPFFSSMPPPPVKPIGSPSTALAPSIQRRKKKPHDRASSFHPLTDFKSAPFSKLHDSQSARIFKLHDF